MISRPGSPLKGRGAIGDNGDDDVNGDKGASIATMVIHWRTEAKMASSAPMVTMVRVWVRTSFIVVVGTNGAIGDPIPLAPMSSMAPFVPVNQRLAPS